ncbi:class I SAM-dependent methyltransferase [Candidatus Omnitrophota bacterium]
MKRYAPTFTDRELHGAHELFEERRNVYLKEGLDFFKSREFILKKAGSLNGDILEIGSGRGITALSLARTGYSFTSVDNNEEMLKIAALNLAYENLLKNVKLYLMDAYSLEFDDNSFDNVLLIEALHHLDDIERLFSGLNRITAPGAKFILADFNEKGYAIIDRVHEREGRAHGKSQMGRDEAQGWLSEKGFDLETYEDTCHWLIVAQKPTASP